MQDRHRRSGANQLDSRQLRIVRGERFHVANRDSIFEFRIIRGEQAVRLLDGATAAGERRALSLRARPVGAASRAAPPLPRAVAPSGPARLAGPTPSGQHHRVRV